MYHDSAKEIVGAIDTTANAKPRHPGSRADVEPVARISR
jgi:hypothetical protein